MSPKDKDKEGTPQKIAETTPQLSAGDFSYLEIIMNMHNTMGRLTEAVDSLKSQSHVHDGKLDQIGKDVHAAKVTMGVLSAVIVAAAAFIGWLVTTYISAHPAH